MDIDKAINESDDRRLKTKYENAIYVIKRALSLYSLDEVAFSFNGGKDSTVLFHLLRAGYYLQKWSRIHSKGALPDNKVQFPVRTLYFESPCAFPEIDMFTHVTAESYGVQMDIIKLDFKSGLEDLLKSNPVRAIFLGVRIGDPTAVGQEQFSPSSPGWPPFMRINPILDWSYRDVWAFILTCKVPYCSLYDQGYTSVGSIYDTVPNSLLRVHDSSCNKEKFRPAYLLSDGRLERAGRVKRSPCPVSGLSLPISNGPMKMDIHQSTALVAGVIAVGDEILSGIVKDEIGPMLLKKLHSIGWMVSQTSVVRNEVDSVADEVEKWKSQHDMVFIYGGVGPLPSDITMAGVAKAFGVRLAPDEEFEEYLRHLIGDHCTGDRNEMAQLPESITQLIHHVNLNVPLINCGNVIVFNATNVKEFENEWASLMDLTASSGFLPLPLPFISRNFSSHLLDVEAAPYLLHVSLQHPDISIGCYRGARSGPLYLNFRAKDEADIETAVKALFELFPEGSISEIK